MPVTEVIVGNVSAHGNTCIGCVREKKAVLLCLSDETKYDINKMHYDFFLNTEQALFLYETLGRAITNNILQDNKIKEATIG